MFHELCETGYNRAHEGSREGKLGDRQGGKALPLIASPLPGGLVGW